MEERNYNELPESDVVVNYIVARKGQGLYTLIFISGLPGTGKTSTCMRLAELTSIKLTGKNIITEENVLDDNISLVKFVQNAKPEEVNIGVLEEVSVLFPSRRAMSGDNVAVGKILDTARKKQVILFANAPLWTSIDSHLRALGNVYIETLRINKTDKVVISKALRLQTNPGSGKTYFHWFTRKGMEVHRIFTKQSNKETWEKYELKKDKFMDELYEDLKFTAIKKKEKRLIEMGKRVKPTIVKPLSPRELEVYDLKFRGDMKGSDIARKLGLDPSRITRILNNIKQKINIGKENEGIDDTTPSNPPLK